MTDNPKAVTRLKSRTFSDYPDMYLFVAALLAGFLLLMWSANQLVNSASNLRQRLNVSGYIIGFLVLGFGTSAPELLVSGFSAWQGNPGLAIGNALGSNSTNILLILGVALCIAPLHLNRNTLYMGFMILLAATSLFAGLIFDQRLQFHDGLILLLTLLGILIYKARLGPEEQVKEPSEQTLSPQSGLTLLLVKILTSLVLLILSSKLVVWSSVSIAEYLGTSDLIIGLTIVAIGTSLPELATCITCTLKKQSELVLGNIIGSNIFNTLGVVGTASLISAYDVPREIFVRDLPTMSAATAVLLILALVCLRTGRIPRGGFGVIFIASYIAYILIVYQQSVQV